MFYKTNDNQNLYYEVHGNSHAKETIVFLNGLSQSTIAWSLTIPHFQDHYQIVLLDFIFQGKSDKGGDWRNFDSHAQDIMTLLDHLKLSKVIIVGLSYGSIVAQHLAVNYGHRISKLILLATFAHKTPYYEAIELSWWRALEYGGYDLMLDIMLPSVLSETYFKNPLIPIDLMKQARQESNNDSQALFKLMRATKEREDYRPQLQKIKTPTLVVQGEKDLLLPVHLAEEVAKSIPNSTLKIIPMAGHTLNLESVPQMCHLMKDFLLK